jgi:hypothetical protein
MKINEPESDHKSEIVEMSPPIFEKSCEMTKHLEWNSLGNILYQVTSKGVKICSLNVQKDLSLQNIDYLEDSSEVVAFTGDNSESVCFFATLEAKICRYDLIKKSTVTKQMDSKVVSLKTDSLRKWLFVLCLDNKFFAVDFKTLEIKKNIPISLDLPNKSMSPIVREDVTFDISPDLEHLVIPNMENHSFGSAIGLSSKDSFDICFMLGLSSAELTCIKFFPFVCYKNQVVVNQQDIKQESSAKIESSTGASSK